MIVIKDSAKFTALISAFSNHESFNMIVDNQGMVIRAYATEGTSLTDAFIPKEAFETYDNIENTLKFNVNLEEFIKYLKRADKDSKIKLDFDVDMKIEITGKWTKRYNMAVGAFDPKSDKLPKVELKNTVKTTVEILKEICDDIKLVNNAMILKVENCKIMINGETHNRGATLDFFMSDKPVLELESGQDANVPYQIQFFEKVLTAVKGYSDNVKMRFDSKMPMVISIEISGLCILHHFVAPYIREEAE